LIRDKRPLLVSEKLARCRVTEGYPEEGANEVREVRWG
jgi:hypothetical protein